MTCPTVRIHPAVIAQAAATSAVLTGGRFRLGVGTGEALNEHIFGDAWPEADVRLEMLEEAVEIMRGLWAGGNVLAPRQALHRRERPDLHAARDSRWRSWSPASARRRPTLAAPDRRRLRQHHAGRRPGHAVPRRGRRRKVCQAGFKAAYADSEEEGARLAYEKWPNAGVPGELSQVLPSPKHFEQAAQLVTQDMVQESFVCGNDPEAHLEMIDQYAEAGFDEVYVANTGPHYPGPVRSVRQAHPAEASIAFACRHRVGHNGRAMMKLPMYGPRLRRVARQQFGWPSLRPGQFKPMRAVLRRRDALVVLPTGAGKSAIYQIPAVLLPGPTVVISPLLALQQDQIAALNERDDPKIRAVRVSSAETPHQQREAIRRDPRGPGRVPVHHARAAQRPGADGRGARRSSPAWSRSTRRTASRRGATTSGPTTWRSAR